MRKTSLLLLLGMMPFFCLFPSCTAEEAAEPPAQETNIDPEIIKSFVALGFDVSDIKAEMFTDPITGKTERHFILEQDIHFTLAQLRAMQVQEDMPAAEQYRTTNLVTGLPRTIKVLGYKNGTSSASLDATMETALQMAVANYNALNTDLNFTLTFGSNTSGQDIVVQRVSGSGGGSAGFPSGGNPYGSVYIQSGTSNYGTDVTEHVMTHEIGHCVGLRHTDYFNRSISCGSGGNEGSAGVGAIHIPGTPTTTNVDLNSVMLACFSSNETGEFSSYDRIALEELYGSTSSSCGGDPYLTLSPHTINIGASGGTRTVSISSNVDWTVTGASYWISVSPTSGSCDGTITLTIARNTSDCRYNRFGSVNIDGGAAGSDFIFIDQEDRFYSSENGFCRF